MATPRTTAAYATARLTPWPRDISFGIRAAAFTGALAQLIWLDLCGLAGFRVVHSHVANTRLAPSRVSYDALTLVRVAVRDACILYFKPVHCLQRSAAVTRMLRRRGVPARLVIGYQATPIQGHAWVELNGEVVWDQLPGLSFYRVLERI